jgi:hypothetical protein
LSRFLSNSTTSRFGPKRPKMRPLQLKRRRVIKSWRAGSKRVLTTKAATEKVNQKIKSAENTTTANWNAFKAKVAADMDGLKTMVAERKQEFDAKRAENTAERLEWEAGVAVDYAISLCRAGRSGCARCHRWPQRSRVS